MGEISIKAIRVDRNYTQEDVANYLQIARQTYSQKERGYTEFTFAELIKLSKLFDVPISTFKH